MGREEWGEVVSGGVQEGPVVVALSGGSVKAARIQEFLVGKGEAILSNPPEAVQWRRGSWNEQITRAASGE